MQEVYKERTDPAHAGLLSCPVQVQTAYRIVNDYHRKDPASCDILSRLGMGPEHSWCWDPGFSHCPRTKSPASASTILACPQEAPLVCAEPRSRGVLL